VWARHGAFNVKSGNNRLQKLPYLKGTTINEPQRLSYTDFLQGQKLLQNIEAVVMNLQAPTIAINALI
jgi:hypothetical protein